MARTATKARKTAVKQKWKTAGEEEKLAAKPTPKEELRHEGSKMQRLRLRQTVLKALAAARAFSRRHGPIAALALAALLLAACAYAANRHYYTHTAGRPSTTKFAEELHKREKFAKDYLDDIQGRVKRKGIWDLMHDPKIYADSKEKDMSVYIYDNDSLKFWSSNTNDIWTVAEIPYKSVFFLSTHNSYCIGVQKIDGSLRYVALLRFRHRFLQREEGDGDEFADGFDLPRQMRFVDRLQPMRQDIKSANGTYLFSLQYSGARINPPLAQDLCLASVAALLLVLVAIGTALSAKGSGLDASLPYYTLGCTAAIALSMALGWPGCIYQTYLFSPANYASQLCPSLGHLIVCTALATANIAAIARSRSAGPRSLGSHMPQNAAMLLAGSYAIIAGAFSLAYRLSESLVFNSVVDITVTNVQDISLATIIAVLLIVWWFALPFALLFNLALVMVRRCSTRQNIAAAGATLAILAAAYAASKGTAAHLMLLTTAAAVVATLLFIAKLRRHRQLYFSLAAFGVINISIGLCNQWCRQKDNDQLSILAENLTDNQTLQHDELTELLLKTDGNKLSRDRHLWAMLKDTLRTSSEAVEYIGRKYFQDLDNDFETDIQVLPQGQPLLLRKSTFGTLFSLDAAEALKTCQRLDDSPFSISLRNDIPLAYIGTWQGQGQSIYVTLYPSLTYKARPGRQAAKKLPPDLSVAKYFGSDLLYCYGDYHYQSTPAWIPNVRHTSFKFNTAEYDHYVQTFGGTKGRLVVSKKKQTGFTYFIFVSYLCALVMLLFLLASFLWWLLEWGGRPHTVLSKMYLWLLSPTLTAFVLVALLSTRFFMERYESKTNSDISLQAGSIAHIMQQRLGTVPTLEATNKAELAKALKEMSTYFGTDIIAYDERGKMTASSRPFVFDEKKYTNKNMNPVPYFLKRDDYCTRVEKGDREIISYYTPLYNLRNDKIGYLNLRSTYGAKLIRDEMANILVVVLDLYLVIVLLLLFVCRGISYRLTKPLEQLVNQFRKIKLTGENTKVTYNGDDEIGQLVNQYNLMVEQLRASAEELAWSQRDMAWRDMARRIAHEIRNPLTPMKLSVQVAQLKKQRSPEQFDSYFDQTCETLIEQIDNLSRIASEFSTFAKTTATVREKVDLAGRLRSAAMLFGNNQEGVEVEARIDDSRQATIWSDGRQILQVFNNLFRNAIQAMDGRSGGRIDATLGFQRENVVVSVADNGCGIAPENLTTIFEPNFTTKTSGMGLGLAIVKTIITQAGGTIWVDSQVGRGTTFFISIPLAEDEEKAEKANK